MMKRISLILLIVILAALPLASAYAEDPAIGSKEDNACNAGGSLEGKCDTAWAWVCGWYLARYQAGIIPNVISACSILVPPAPEAEAAAEEFATCYEGTIHDLVFTGPLNTLNNGYYTVGSLNGCADVFNLFRNVISAPSMVDAQIVATGLGVVAPICAAMNGIGFATAPANWYICF